MKNRNMKLIAIIYLVILSSFVCAQDIKKWIDEDGNVHFSDKAPMGVEANSVHIKKVRLPRARELISKIFGNPNITASTTISMLAQKIYGYSVEIYILPSGDVRSVKVLTKNVIGADLEKELVRVFSH
jgi:hypothetical protein